MTEQLYIRPETRLKLMSNIEKTAFPIWHDLFQVRVTMRDTYGNQEIQVMGLPSEGDEHYDRIAHMDNLDTMFTVSQMVDYATQGKGVSLKHASDSLPILRMLDNYLHCWKREIEESVNLHRPPVVDLINMCRFAEKCHHWAVQFMPKETPIALFSFSEGMSRQAMENRAGYGVVETIANKIPVYNSLEGYFSEIKIRN